MLRQADDSTVLKGVVMDGMDTGILGPLLPFDSPATLVDASRDTAKLQYIFPYAKAQLYFESMFNAAVVSALRGCFDFKVEDMKTSINSD